LEALAVKSGIAGKFMQDFAKNDALYRNCLSSAIRKSRPATLCLPIEHQVQIGTICLIWPLQDYSPAATPQLIADIGYGARWNR